MIPQYMLNRPRVHYRRFCEELVVENAAEGPVLTICGLGYHNRNRANKLPYCTSHLKSHIQKERLRQ